MPRPIVEVLQTVANITTTINDPEQDVLLIGPQYNTVAYSPAVPGTSIGDYDPTSADITNVTTADVDYDISSRGTVDVSTGSSYPARLFLENAFFSIATEGSVKSSAALSSDPLAARANTVVAGTDLQADSADYAVAAGDSVVVQFLQATKFVANTEITLTNPTEVKIHVGSVDNATVDGAGGKVIFWSSDQMGPISSTVAYFSDVAAGDFFSKQTVGGTLDNDAGDVVTIRLEQGGASEVVVGTLAVPETQVTTVSAISADGLTLTVNDTLRQLALLEGNANKDAAAGLRIRVEKSVSTEFSGSIPSAGLEWLASSDDWVISNANSDLQISTPLNLRDTNLPSASSLPNNFITRADLYLQSRGINVTNTNLAQTVNSSTLEDILGAPAIENPLSLAASIALQNSGSSSIRVLRIASDDSQGYLNARSIINNDPNVYAIIPLTTDISVINTLVTDAVNASDNKFNFRIVIGASEGAPTKKYWRGSESTYVDGEVSAVANDIATLTDHAASFSTAASVGDKVEVYLASDPSVVRSTTIQSIVNNQSITIKYANGEGLAAGAVKYNAYKDISALKDEQVTVLNDRISTHSAQKRLVMVYPGSCTVLGESGQPGYYLGAALGGMLAAFEPHRPKNNIAISGIDDIAASNLGYFSDDQIDSLSDNGYFVFVQETAGGLPFCVHQVTCGYRDFQSTQEISELSVVNNYDYVSKVFKNTLTPYVGTWNVIPQAFASISSSLDSAILSLRARVVDRIGAPLRDAEIISVEESPSDAGTVVILLNVSLPKVLNKIQITLESQ